MRARLAFVLFSVLVLWALGEIAGAPSSGDSDKLIKLDEEFHAGCLNRRKTEAFSNCKSCETDMEPGYGYGWIWKLKSALGVECKKKHTGMCAK